MAGNILKKLLGIFGLNEQQDIVPRDMHVPRGLARDLTPLKEPEKQAPRAGGRLKGTVQTLNDHQQVYIEVEDSTEELLALTEDVIAAQESEGFDPYNTGKFKSAGVWESKKRHRD